MEAPFICVLNIMLLPGTLIYLKISLLLLFLSCLSGSVLGICSCAIGCSYGMWLPRCARMSFFFFFFCCLLVRVLALITNCLLIVLFSVPCVPPTFRL
ncbi:hypothetical protein CPB86DRAFT_621990 [Serendipita vermifera]|nr:hypothetical protein CPB86DRAFT_621990 [Serendipita vermifera]